MSISLEQLMGKANNDPVVIEPAWSAWARMIVGLVNHCGVIHMPSSGVVYMVDHERKELTLLTCPPWYLDSQFERLNTLVFQSVGYTLKRYPMKQVQVTVEEVTDRSQKGRNHEQN